MVSLLWANLVLGIWLVTSPWVLESQGAKPACRMNAMLSGIAVFMISGAVLLASTLVR